MSTNTCGIRHKSSSTTGRCMFFRGKPNFLSVGQTPWYRTTRCFCYTVDWHQIHLTFVGSSPSADNLVRTLAFSLSSCVWPLIAFERAHSKKGGSFPEFPSCTSPEFLAHFLGHYFEMHVVSQFLVHFVHLSGRAQLAHSAFSCCGAFSGSPRR